MSTFCLLLGLYVTLTHQSGFTSPNYVVAYGPGQYQSNVLWYVGETKEVVYDISDVVDGLEEYTIALWQQSMAGGGATLGPVVNSKAATDADRSSFTWTVNLYDFDEAWSNVFFFWIFNGSATDQGNMDGPNVSSAYFNITADDPPTISSSTSSSTTSMTSTSATSTVTSATTSETASNTEPTQTTTDSANTVPTSEAAGSGSSGTGNGGGISTGAGVGIGVGVGLVGISAVVCAGIIVWYKRKKRDRSQENTQYGGLHELPTRGDRQPSPKGWHMSQTSSTYDSLPRYGYGSGGSSTETGGLAPQAINHGHPAELNSGRGWPVELDGRGRNSPRAG